MLQSKVLHINILCLRKTDGACRCFDEVRFSLDTIGCYSQPQNSQLVDEKTPNAEVKGTGGTPVLQETANIELWTLK